MNVISKIYLCLLPLTAFACQRQPIDGVAAGASGGAIAATSRRPVEVADAPLADYQRELLLLAFDAASKFPSVPHSKNRGRAQDLVVSACFRMNQPMLALSFAPRVEGYYQAVAYADFAWCCAKAGDAKRTKDYVKLAEVALKSENDDANAQEWRTDKVRIKIARALATLGEHAKAQEVLGKVSAASTGAVDAGWTGTMAERVAAMQLVDAEAELARITETFLSQVLGEQFTSLMLMSGMHGRFFDNEVLRTALEERLFVRFNKLPTNLRLDAMAPLVAHYVDHGDRDGGRDVIVRMTDLMAQFSFRPEERVPQLARIAQLRMTCGDEPRARAELQQALLDYHEHRDDVVNIYRCETLRPLALAWHAVGDSREANDLVALALEESLENPNSRPRCDDLVETCIEMAEQQLKPSDELWHRMREIRVGLSTPW